MEDNKLRFWMASHHPVSRLLQLQVSGEVLTVKGPIRVCTQLLIPFIEAIRGQKECFGIRRVNGNRHTLNARNYPHRVEASVINLHKRSTCNLLAQVETKRL